MLLTKEEKDKFIDWLMNEANSNRMLAEQMKKMGGPAMEAIAKNYTNKADAAMLIMKSLIESELQTIRG